MRSVYDRCCSYAWKCSPLLYKDLVHQAWIVNHDKDGTNLFDKNIFYAFKCIRWVWFNEIKRGKFSVGGKNEKREYFNRVRLDLEDIAPLRSNTRAQDDELITREFYEELYRRIDSYNSGHPLGASINPQTLRTFTEMLDQGYSVPEIARRLDVTVPAAHYYKKKIKTIIEQMQLTNPFVANPLRVTKKITRKEYNSNKEQYEREYEFNYDRDSDSNESYELRTHRERYEGLLIIEKEKLYRFKD